MLIGNLAQPSVVLRNKILTPANKLNRTGGP